MPEASNQLAQMLNDPSGGLSSIAPAQPAFDTKKTFDALDQVVVKRTEAERAKIEALNANTLVTNNLLSEQEKLDAQNLEAYDNLGRINQLGGDNPITKIMGIFDRRYNKAAQETQLLKNQLKAQSVQRNAETQVNINNAKPALLSGEADIAALNFDLYKDTLSLTSTMRGIEQKDQELAHDAIRIRMSLSDERRKEVDFAVNSMDEPQLRQALRDAKAGKGDFVGLEGLLTKELNDFEKFNLELVNTRSLIASRVADQRRAEAGERRAEAGEVRANNADRRAEAGEQRSSARFPLEIAGLQADLSVKAENALKSQMEKMVSYLPVDQMDRMVNEAISSGRGAVTFGSGADAVDIPLDIMMKGAIDKKTMVEGVEKNLFNESRLELSRTFNHVTSSAAMMASTDRRAMDELNALAVAKQNADLNNPGDVRVLKRMADAVQARLEKYVEQNSAVYNSPEAKAAFKQAIATGEFTSEGADALVEATAGNFRAQSQAFHAGAYTILNNKIAAEIKAQQFTDMPKLDGSAGSSMALMTWALKNSQAKEKMPDIIRRVMLDPEVKGQMATAIKTGIELDTFTSSMRELAQAPYPSSPIYKGLLEGDKNLTPEQVLEHLVLRSIEAGPGVDYGQSLIDQLNKRATDARNSNVLSDPRYTIADRAIEAAHFGMDPRGPLSREFADRMARSLKRIRAEKEQAMRADISGQTQAQSMQNYARMQAMGADAGASMQEIVRDRPEIANPKSATGANLPTSRIQEMYGR